MQHSYMNFAQGDFSISSIHSGDSDIILNFVNVPTHNNCEVRTSHNALKDLWEFVLMCCDNKYVFFITSELLHQTLKQGIGVEGILLSAAEPIVKLHPPVAMKIKEYAQGTISINQMHDEYYDDAKFHSNYNSLTWEPKTSTIEWLEWYGSGYTKANIKSHHKAEEPSTPSGVSGLPGMETLVKHPITGYERPLWNQIISLNDHHRWTREQIADWLETLDIDLRFPVDAAH